MILPAKSYVTQYDKKMVSYRWQCKLSRLPLVADNSQICHWHM